MDQARPYLIVSINSNIDEIMIGCHRHNGRHNGYKLCYDVITGCDMLKSLSDSRLDLLGRIWEDIISAHRVYIFWCIHV